MMVAVACMTCGTELRPSAKFCEECGSPTAAPGTAAGYKQLTVLFADAVGSMDIAADALPAGAVVDSKRAHRASFGCASRAARAAIRPASRAASICLKSNRPIAETSGSMIAAT
jgi:class 3 adenylate cyclase